MITSSLTNYTLERLAYMDRAIIRLATYEMAFTDTPKPVVINEAIQLTKSFCNLEDEKQSAFSNRLLDNIAKRLGDYMQDVRYLTVTALTKYLKNILENNEHLRQIYIKGEISNLTKHSRGHYSLP